ncbi:hypothetical protein [Paraburkholderia sp. GAS32]|uniref:hypothetical protein n=1 Tax=Paraburkholderia sp. GAS32 TaxID=3035129 RepID=UPI003D224C97
MLKRITERISYITIGRAPVGGVFLLIVICSLMLAGLFVYWNVMDAIPRWVDKVAFIYFAMFAYGRYLEKKELNWLNQREHLSFRIELLCSDLDLIRASTADFGIIGRSGVGNASYAEFSTRSLETVTGWRKILDASKRPYKYITSVGSMTENDPQW